MYGGVVLDIGNTLVVAVDFMEHAYLEVFREFDIDQSHVSLYKKFSGRAKHHLFEAVLPDGPGKAEKVRTCVAALIRSFKRDVETLREVPGAQECLRQLAEMRVKVALVSGFPREIGEEIVEKFRWSYPCVFYEDVKEHRPAPDPVLKAAEMIQMSPKELLVVGDSPNDVISARAAGSDSAAVATGKYQAAELAEFDPTYILPSVAEVPDLLRKGHA